MSEIIEYEIVEPPKEFLDKFKHKNIEFSVDKFEQIMLQDIYRYDQETLEKISRNVTSEFRDWMHDKIKKKENISISTMGNTREGKSLGMLSICDDILGNYDGKEFDTLKIVCGNQKEFRLNLSENTEFGDVYQIDENAFTQVGLGSMTEMQQLKDIQNIIAKKNVHTIYITPRMFLDNNATMGLKAWGKDANNWLSRFLVYRLTNKLTPLMGYLIIDVGKLFRKYGCYLYRELGGCTNPNKLKLDDLNKENLKHSSCLPKEKLGYIAEYTASAGKFKEPAHLSELINDGSSCPFYDICKHPLAKYEHKKDTWIQREMEGGLDERVAERMETALKLFKKLATFNEEKSTMLLKVKNKGQLTIRVQLLVGSVSGTKYTKTELEEIVLTLTSMCDIHFFKDSMTQLKKDWKQELSECEEGKKFLDVIGTDLDEEFKTDSKNNL